MTSDTAPVAAEHARRAADFTTVVANVADWELPSPVPGWTARDVVRHLTDWLPSLLATSSELRLPDSPSVDDDPIGRWRAQTDAVQALLEDSAAADLAVTNAQLPPGLTVAGLLGQFYVPDVFMHTWDLARATGQPDRLDPALATEMLAGMETIEPMLRASGQFGTRQPVTADADPTDRLIAFIGRDPAWRPPGGTAI